MISKVLSDSDKLREVVTAAISSITQEAALHA
jgi:hypothetical protein